MCNRFKIVSSRLFVPYVCENACIPGSSSEVFAISEWNVLTVRALVTFSQTEIDDINSVLGLFVASSHKIIRFNIPMDDSFLMNYSYSFNHLSGNVKTCSKIELSLALLE